jgi:nitrogen fixation protein FixH
MSNNEHATKRHHGRIVLYGLIGFFLTFMTVDAVMVTLAVRSQTGVVTDHAFEKGLAYNDTIAAARDQEKLGWRGTFSNNQGKVVFHLEDKQGVPLSGAKIRMKIWRPVHDGEDKEDNLVEIKPGQYEAWYKRPFSPGLWQVDIHAVKDDQNFRFSEQFMVPR